MTTVRQCHYCGAPGNTRDHIVPRSLAKRDEKGHWALAPNIVRACTSCNQAKGSKRSDCPCPRCELAWEMFGPGFEVEVWRAPPRLFPVDEPWDFE